MPQKLDTANFLQGLDMDTRISVSLLCAQPLVQFELYFTLAELPGIAWAFFRRYILEVVRLGCMCMEITV